jgi:hypothetical protein
MNDAAAPAVAPQTTASEDEITPDEKACFNWYEALAKEDPTYFSELPAEDQAVLMKHVKFQDDPDAVRRSRASIARVFLAHIGKKGIKPTCNETQLTSTLIKVSKKLHVPTTQKPTDLLTARTYVWSTLMTQEEKLTWCKEGYLSNPIAAETTIANWSKLLTNELVTLKLVEDTQEARAAKAKELADEKKAFLRKTYLPSEANAQ